jgi:hypothetical protein
MRIFCVSIPVTDAKEPSFAEASEGEPSCPNKGKKSNSQSCKADGTAGKSEPPESADPGGVRSYITS